MRSTSASNFAVVTHLVHINFIVVVVLLGTHIVFSIANCTYSVLYKCIPVRLLEAIPWLSFVVYCSLRVLRYQPAPVSVCLGGISHRLSKPKRQACCSGIFAGFQSC